MRVYKVRVYKVRDAQYPIGIELNNVNSKLTLKAANELYESLDKELNPISYHAMLDEVTVKALSTKLRDYILSLGFKERLPGDLLHGFYTILKSELKRNKMMELTVNSSIDEIEEIYYRHFHEIKHTEFFVVLIAKLKMLDIENKQLQKIISDAYHSSKRVRQ